MSLKKSHDVEIVDSKGKPHGFMLAAEGGQKHWKVTDTAMLPMSLITGEASYSNLAPEDKILLEADDWRRGFQDEVFETAKKYYKTANCDGRFKGRFMLSPKELTALALEASAPSVSITDADLEDWATTTNLTSWTETGSGVTRTGTVHSGTYGAYVATETTITGSIYQNLTWNDAYKGKVFIFKAWAKVARESDANNWVRVSIYDGAGTTYSAKHQTNTWTQIQVEKKLASNASVLRVIIDYSASYLGTGTNVWFDDTSLVNGNIAGAPKKLINFGSTLCVAYGQMLYKLSAGSWVYCYGFPATITDLCVYQNRLYIALGYGVKYYYTSDLSSFIHCTLDDTTAKYMSNVQDTQFWISDTANTMRDSANPINGGGAFSTVYALPNSSYSITGLLSNQDSAVVYARKQDQTYYLSGANVYPLIPALSSEASTTYSYGLYIWQGRIYIPAGVNSLYEYDDGIVTDLSPMQYARGDTDHDGSLLALTTDSRYLYLVIDNGTKYELLAGHWETIGGATTWVWHPIYEKTSNDVTCALISNLSGYNRLYLGTNTYTDGIPNFVVPVSYSDVLKESGHKVEASGTFYTPKLRTNFPTMDKLWNYIMVTSQNFKDKTTIKVSYKKRGDSDWTSLGYCTEGDYTSVVTPWSFTYPDEITDKKDIGIVSDWVWFKFDLTTTEEKLSPILLRYSVDCCLMPSMADESTKKKTIEMIVRAGDNLQNASGITTHSTIASIVKEIETLNKTNNPFKIMGCDNTWYTARFEPVGTEQRAYIDESGRNTEIWITCRLKEV